MSRFKVTYQKKGYFGFAAEIIKARGIMHASKLANDHAREMRKTLGDSSIRVYTIKVYVRYDNKY